MKWGLVGGRLSPNPVICHASLRYEQNLDGRKGKKTWKLTLKPDNTSKKVRYMNEPGIWLKLAWSGEKWRE